MLKNIVSCEACNRPVDIIGRQNLVIFKKDGVNHYYCSPECLANSSDGVVVKFIEEYSDTLDEEWIASISEEAKDAIIDWAEKYPNKKIQDKAEDIAQDILDDSLESSSSVLCRAYDTLHKAYKVLGY